MGTLVELKQRVSSDWTPFERIQLESLMDCLPAKAACDIAFGVSDIGDPWCAVMDEEGEVVLHVARIQGRFYVHSTVEPFVADARDLPSAVSPFVENFRRPTAMVLPLFESIMPLHAFGAFETASDADDMGPSWARDADASAQDGDPAVQPLLPEAAADEPAAAPALAADDAPPLAEPAVDEAPVDEAPPLADMPAFMSQDDLTVTYELFYRGGDPIRLDNAAADLPAQPANDETAALAAPVFETPPAADNVLSFPAPANPPSGPDAGSTGVYSQQVDDLVRAAAQDDAHADPAVPAWDQPAPFDLTGVLPSAEAF